MHNYRLPKLKFKYLINDITINILFFEIFLNMYDIRKKKVIQYEFIKIYV